MATDNQPLDLDALLAIVRKRTPGKWYARYNPASPSITTMDDPPRAIGTIQRKGYNPENPEADCENLDAIIAAVNNFEAVAREVLRLRELLNRCRLEPDRCEQFPKGEQCGLKAGHEGKCRWLNGD